MRLPESITMSPVVRPAVSGLREGWEGDPLARERAG